MPDEFDVLVSEQVQAFLQEADEKTERICRENLAHLTQPYPGRGPGDTERITWKGEEVYRLHIGRTWTAFYDILTDEGELQALKILPIDDAHKEYGE